MQTWGAGGGTIYFVADYRIFVAARGVSPSHRHARDLGGMFSPALWWGGVITDRGVGEVTIYRGVYRAASMIDQI